MKRDLVNQKNIENIMLSAIEDKLSHLIDSIYQVIEAKAKNGLNITSIYCYDFEGYNIFDWRRIKIYFEKQGFIVEQHGQRYTIIW